MIIMGWVRERSERMVGCGSIASSDRERRCRVREQLRRYNSQTDWTRRMRRRGRRRRGDRKVCPYLIHPLLAHIWQSAITELEGFDGVERESAVAAAGRSARERDAEQVQPSVVHALSRRLLVSARCILRGLRGSDSRGRG